jgi:hypothetical protein
MDSAAVQLSPAWHRGLHQTLDTLRREHPEMGFKKLMQELKKDERYACASSRLVRTAMAVLDARDAAQCDPVPESEAAAPAQPDAAVENRASRRARMKAKEKAAKKKHSKALRKGSHVDDKSGSRTLSKHDMWLLQSDLSTASGSGALAANSHERMPLKDTKESKEMRARLETYQEDEKQMGLLNPNTVLQLKAYYDERLLHYAELKKQLERKWTLNSAIIHERVKGIDDDRYEAARQNCQRLMQEKEEYDATTATLVYCREAFLRSPSKIAVERHIAKTFHFQDVNEKLSAAERKEAARHSAATGKAMTVLEKHAAWRGYGGVPANVRKLRGIGATDETAAPPQVDHYIAVWSQALNRAWQNKEKQGELPVGEFSAEKDIARNSCEWPFAKAIEVLMRRPSDDDHGSGESEWGTQQGSHGLAVASLQGGPGIDCSPKALATMFATGETVEVAGLQGAPQHNGKLGVVQHFDNGKGRFVVKVDGLKKPLAVKPANLMSRTNAINSTQPVKSEEDEKFERLMAEMQGITQTGQTDSIGCCLGCRQMICECAAESLRDAKLMPKILQAADTPYEMNDVRWTIVRMAFCSVDTHARERITAADLKAWSARHGLSTPPPQPENGEGTRVCDLSLFGKGEEHVSFERWLQMFLPSSYCPSSPMCALENTGTESEPIHPDILKTGEPSVSWAEFKERYRQMSVDPPAHISDFQHAFDGWPPPIPPGTTPDLMEDSRWAWCIRTAWRIPLIIAHNAGPWHEAWSSWPTEVKVARAPSTSG